MKLRQKITVTLSTFLTLLIFIVTLLNSHFVMAGFYELQEDKKEMVIKSVGNAVDNMVHRHDLLLRDWANWDAALAYVDGDNPNFATTEIVDRIFIDQKINYILIYDNNLNLMFSKGYDFLNNKSLNIDSNIVSELKKHIDTTGIVEVENSSIAFSSSRIFNSNKTTNGVGLMVLGHIVTNDCLKSVSDETGVGVSFEKHTVADATNITEEELYDKFVIEINEPFLNSTNHLSFIFNVDKDIEMLGIKNFHRLLMYTVLSVGALGLFVYSIVIKFVRRMEKISNELANIRSLSDTEYRIPVKGEDEVSLLSGSINNMLDKILLMNNKLVESATLDLLTGVYNRRTGLEKLDRIIEYTKKNNEDLTICFIDINDLKEVNDVHGHRTGDEYIKKITEVIVRNIRDKDFVCRLGGDEFLIVFKSCTKEDAKKVIGRINRDLDKINTDETYPFKMSISKGIVSYTYDLDIDDFVEMADKRMYIDKTRYRNKRDSEVESSE